MIKTFLLSESCVFGYYIKTLLNPLTKVNDAYHYKNNILTRDEMFVDLQTHGVRPVLVKGKQYVRLGSRLL